MDKFRLAVFNTQPPHLYCGGVERRIIETTKRLSSQFDITVYSGTKAGFRQPTIVDGVNVVPCHSTDRLFPLDNWSFNRTLSKIGDTIVADIYEAHAVSGYGLLKELKRKGIKKPFIHTVHGVLADEYEQAKQIGYNSFRSRVANYFMHRLASSEAETAKEASLIVTISKYSLEKIKQFYDVDEAKVRIVPNGVDPEKFKPLSDKTMAKRQFGLGNEPCVLFVGSLIPRKGLPYLIEAAKNVVKQKPETKFLIVGDGPLKNQLIKAIDAYNLGVNFKFLGILKEELSDAYNAADVFALPSVQEGQGIVMLEAQAAAVPPVAFDVGGVNEAIRDGETGLLVKRSDTDGLADALLRLLSDGALREKMGVNGRKFVVENYTWDLCAERMLRVYNEALGLQR